MRELPASSAAPLGPVPKYLPVKTCANALQLTYTVMWSIIVSGKGPDYVKIGRTIRVAEPDFLKWLDSRKNGK